MKKILFLACAFISALIVNAEPICISVKVPDAWVKNGNVSIVEENYIEGDAFPMTYVGDNWYQYTFSEDIQTATIRFYNIDIYGYSQGYSETIEVSASVCYDLSSMERDAQGGLKCQMAECPQIEYETYTIRFNPFVFNTGLSISLFVWTGGNDLYSTPLSKMLIRGEVMKLNTDDNWLTYSFEAPKGISYRIGICIDDSYLFSDNSYTGSTCFTVVNNKLQSTSYRSLTPDASNSYVVNVPAAGTFGQTLLQVLGDKTWTDVAALTVTGMMNEEDMNYWYRLKNLQHLDLSGTNITHIGGCSGLKRLLKVTLPKTCTRVDKDAFTSCYMLHSINLDNIDTIENNAFQYCNRLSALSLPRVIAVGDYAFSQIDIDLYSFDPKSTSLDNVAMPMVQSIGTSAFEGNANLTSVTMPLAQSIGDNAFAYCYALTQVDLSNVTYLGRSTFYGYKYLHTVDDENSYKSNLKKVTLSDKLESIPDYCFDGCEKLTSITLPSALKEIGNYALPYLNEVQLPNSVTYVGSGNFLNTTSITIPASVATWKTFSDSWTDVYCHVVSPQNFYVFANSATVDMTLHVPYISVVAYRLHYDWYQFGKILPLEGEIDHITVRDNFTLILTEGISKKATMTNEVGGRLTVKADKALSLGHYVQNISTNYGNLGSMLVANSEMTADNVTIKLIPLSNNWNFFSLPFDVNMSDITITTEWTGTAGTSQWVIREYSGANRASGNGETWQNVPADGVLHANTGYILYWVVEEEEYNKNLTYYFNMPSKKNEKMQAIFTRDDVQVPLASYPAEFPQNSNWNLIGNPYPSAFDIKYLDYEAPITTWNGYGYVPYSPLDDEHTLLPSEAFFVQAPQGINSITFRKEGRTFSVSEPNYYHAPVRRHKADINVRKIYDFTLSNEDYTDRVRLVLNEKASADYELTRDASKMLSSNPSISQLYVNDNGIRYAINERPEGNGVYHLGVVVGKSGSYTLHLNVPVGENRRIILTDTQIGTVTDLSTADYTFSADAGTFDNRFILSFKVQMPTGQDEILPLTNPYKTIENGQLIITTPQGKKYTVGGMAL